MKGKIPGDKKPGTFGLAARGTHKPRPKEVLEEL
jgi:hypothetical protein